MPSTPAWLASLEAVLNRRIQGSARASALARRLNGTALQVDVRGLTAVRAAVQGGRLALVSADAPANESAQTPESDRSADAGSAEATISGSPLALLRLARGDRHRNAAGAAVQIRGDAEIADLYRQLLSLSSPDLEEELSRIVGDLPARRLSQVAIKTVAWARKVRATAGQNMAEYLQEESRDLVNKSELEEFLRGVDALRETADRVEARLARLERRLKGAS